MAPTAELDYRCSTCIINLCKTECQCRENRNKNESNTDINANESVEIIAKGQNLFALTLRTLRLNKPTTLNHVDDEKILNEEKCRPIITLREVADHDTYDDCWIILYDRVYDVTEFLNQVISSQLINDLQIVFFFCFFANEHFCFFFF